MAEELKNNPPGESMTAQSIEPPDETFWENSVDASAVNLADAETAEEKKEEPAAGGGAEKAEAVAEGENNGPQEDEREVVTVTEGDGEAATQGNATDQDQARAEEKGPVPEEAQQNEETAPPADAVEGGIKQSRRRPGRKAVMIAAAIILLIMGSAGFSVIMNQHSGNSVTSKFLGEKRENAYDMQFFLPLNVGYEKERFVKVTIAIELADKEFKKEIDENLSKLRKEVIDLLVTKSPQEVKSSKGKELLRGEITARLNHYLAQDCIKDTYFTELVIL